MKLLRKTITAACLSLAYLLPISATFAAPSSGQPQSAVTHTDSRVSINTADAKTMALKLNGIGEAKAQRIVAWREVNGRFESVEQLLEVKGIGQTILDKNRDHISL